MFPRALGAAAMQKPDEWPFIIICPQKWSPNINWEQDEDIVWVTEGEYECTSTRVWNEITVSVLSGTGRVKMDCHGTSRAFIFEGVSVRLRGFDIINGYADDENGGGAVLFRALKDASVRTFHHEITDCTFSENTGQGQNMGGGGAL
jgi:hypothetical protein